MTKSQGNKRVIAAIALVAVIVGGAATALAQSQRFSDVPPEHEAYEAIEWAAEVEVTTGYPDGTFKPEQPLSKRHAGVFMERYYDLILQVTESPDFTRGDMMRVLKAINDGTPTPSIEPDPEPLPTPEAKWLPRPEGRTAEGRCAHKIDVGIYDWEDCAWGATDDPEMGRAEMQALAEQVWAETSARGKPTNPPTLAEGRCAEARTVACYLPSTHTISIESGVTLRSILHELGHALITGDALMEDCYADWTSVVPHCAHGPLFRCAADALFVRYAGIRSAGVCGDPPDLGDWTRSSGLSRAGRYTDWRVEGYENARRWDGMALVLRCLNGNELEVSTFALGLQSYLSGAGQVEYRFAAQSEPVRVAATEGSIYGYREDGYGDRWVIDRPSQFLGDMAAYGTGELFIALIDERGNVDKEATLETSGYKESVLPEIEGCS